MSAVVTGPVTDRVPGAECGTCEIPFDRVADQSELSHLVGVHNDLHHGGRDEAVLVVPDRDLVDEDADEL